MPLSPHPTVTLNNGVKMPLLGLGVYLAGHDTYDAVRHALEVGYRLVDTATIYENEAEVGRAVRDCGLPRGDVFVTTKLFNTDHGYERTLRACQESLRLMGLDYLDLYLIHAPVEGLRGESWRAMGTLLREGLCRAVGVSNYEVHHLEELLATSGLVPAVNQIEFHPFIDRSELQEYGEGYGIQLQAYSPLTRGARLTDPTLVAVAARYGRSPAQVLIRWGLQHGAVVIPKSTNPERIRENAMVFDFALSAEDMALLDRLSARR